MKKSISFLSLLFGLFVCVAVFSACGGDDDDESSNPLVGTWWIRYIEKGKYHSYDELTFNADLTCSINEYNEDGELKLSYSNKGIYKIDGNYLTIWWNHSDNKPSTTVFSIKGNQLVFPPDSATDGIWTRK